MKTLLLSTILAALTLTSISARSALAEYGDSVKIRVPFVDVNVRNGHSNVQVNAPGVQINTGSHASAQYGRNIHHGHNDNNHNSWNWDQHDWNDQRSHLRDNWRNRNENRVSTIQQQQLDNQMRAQWLQYHQNKWNGASSWDQYSDPAFLDYVHTRNPSLVTSLRVRCGY